MLRILKNRKTVIISALFMLITVMLYSGDLSKMTDSEKEIAQSFLDREDANGDGKVSKEEFKGPEADFSEFDLNNDGMIELSEAPRDEKMPDRSVTLEKREVVINGVIFNVSCPLFKWSELPDDVEYERQGIQEFTDENGVKHYYEAVFVESGNLNWYEVAYLAEDAGGYLACIGSKTENNFVFDLVSDDRYFWSFSEDSGHYGISIGPFLGGYQPEGSEEPAGGWSWLSGEEWEYENWAKDLNDGVIDKDPRPSDQPNNSGGNQPIMGFGEMNLPVSTWGDYMEDVGTYGRDRLPGRSYGFVIEYVKYPD